MKQIIITFEENKTDANMGECDLKDILFASKVLEMHFMNEVGMSELGKKMKVVMDAMNKIEKENDTEEKV